MRASGRSEPVPEHLVAPNLAVRWPAAILSGALIVALAAQVSVPLPFSPVPMTLQPLAVLLVGGLFGALAAGGALVLYLAAGALGAPVFAGGAGGLVWLFGPTGGYLLAFPLAAMVTARLAERGRFLRSLLGAGLGMLVIYLGGWAQLALLSGDAAAAFALGVAPFIGPDLLKSIIAALVLWRAHHIVRPGA